MMVIYLVRKKGEGIDYVLIVIEVDIWYVWMYDKLWEVVWKW